MSKAARKKPRKRWIKIFIEGYTYLNKRGRLTNKRRDFYKSKWVKV